MSALSTTQHHISIARSLPLRLQNFFLRYPPSVTSSSTTDSSPSSTINTQSPSTNIPKTSTFSSEITSSLESSTSPNPFLPYKNPSTNRWRPAPISARIQADIINLSRRHKCLSLLPPCPKLSRDMQRQVEDQGIRVKGTGQGQKVKGKAWERTQKARLQMRVRAMEGMDELVKQWKVRGHGRGWKKWPKKGSML